MMSLCTRSKSRISSLAKRQNARRCAGAVSVTAPTGSGICVEVVVLHAPEHRAPGRVQRGDVAVARGAPVAEGVAGVVRVRERRVVAAVLVVGLPGDDARVVPEALREHGDDARAFVPVRARGEAVVAARAEAPRAPVLVDGEHVRVALEHPGRGGRRRRAEHDLEPGGVQRVDRALEPVEVQRAVRALEPAPGELADAHDGEPEPSHVRRVLGPARLGPVLGVVADARLHVIVSGVRPAASPPRPPCAAARRRARGEPG